MTALTQFRIVPLPGLRGLRAIATAIGTVAMRATRVAEAVKHRREAAMLAGFNDRMLSDIGLTRSDVADAYAEPLWRDPTALLARRAGERRQPRRRPGGLLRRVLAAPSVVPDDDGATETADDHAGRAMRFS
ncbi:DUF1127 domain-containing protein [Rhodoplanes sp. TEM]|uniref:DUF1127 domain-containing protein n=1 Tax=Rhodoplanes tepidamans TaxID=200616 RepID=A0ABT5JJT1_RHOTP|nr:MULTISPECIES: DUF1127 domain-containing protein [Rhodoplanes]MDC7789990.1 DUF1127 domain-containing protein [Rhodoplanes tepidamans]MDC7983868.1 DUF1127 domain-containing protein [Rhodoplanes sp. TEM]MDQ0354305.1 uncharacterized protein YjiS (DUF1127 family) [Rhodoplanes tepidamans]